MGVITIKINDNLEKEFRKMVSRIYGYSRGSLSKAFEEAIDLWMKKGGTDRESSKAIYKAYKNKEIVAEAYSLKNLAEKLREKNIDVREVLITSSIPRRKTTYLGMRTISFKKV